MPSSPPTKRATSPGRGKLVKVRGIENLYRYNKTGIYYAVYHRDGSTRKLSLKTTDRLTAKQALAEVLRDSTRIDHRRANVMTVKRLLELHAETRTSQKTGNKRHRRRSRTSRGSANPVALPPVGLPLTFSKHKLSFHRVNRRTKERDQDPFRG